MRYVGIGLLGVALMLSYPVTTTWVNIVISLIDEYACAVIEETCPPPPEPSGECYLPTTPHEIKHISEPD